MDVSGVDVDFLSDDELLELCSDVVDSKNNEIFVLKGVDIDNLSDDKIQDVYDDVIYGNQNLSAVKKVIPLTEQQVLDLNYNIVDMDSNEIALLKGQNIDFDNLSEQELISLYDDMIISSGDEQILIANTTLINGYVDELCTPIYYSYTSSTYGTTVAMVYGVICYDNTYNMTVVVHPYGGGSSYSLYQKFDKGKYPNMFINMAAGYYLVQYGKYFSSDDCYGGAIYVGSVSNPYSYLLSNSFSCYIK